MEAVTYEIGNYRDYFFDLSPGRNQRNPWFEEYWEQVIGCKFIHSRWTPFNQHYDWTCVGDEKLLDKEGFHIEKRLQYISEAVLAFAHALNVSDWIST